MSWEGFKKAINRAGNNVIIKNVDKTVDQEYNLEERRFKKLEKNGVILAKESREYLNSLKSITQSQLTIAEVISNLFADSKLQSDNSIGDYYLQSIKNLDSEAVRKLEAPFQETVLDPITKFSNFFKEVDEAIKKRERKKQDYDAAKAKVRRLVDKPAKDVSKLPRAEKELDMARDIYENLNNQLKTELPQLVALRIPYYDPSFEALIKIQLRFCTDVYSRLAQIQQHLDQDSRDDYANGLLDERIADLLQKMSNLSICNAGLK